MKQMERIHGTWNINGWHINLDNPETYREAKDLHTCTFHKKDGAPKVEVVIKGPGQLPDGREGWLEHCRFELQTPHVEREIPRKIQVNVEGRNPVEVNHAVTIYEQVIIEQNGVCTSELYRTRRYRVLIAALCTMCWQAR